MHVSEAIRQRRSIRHFSPEPVSVTDLREIIALAAQAPSVGNRQMWRFIVVMDDHLRAMLGHLVERKIDKIAAWPESSASVQQRLRAWREYSLHFVKAPVAIFVINQGYHTPLDSVLTEHGLKQSEVDNLFYHPDIQSISCMIAYLTLLAEERGYGTCWVTDALIARKDIESSLNLQPGEEVAAIVTLGKPTDHPTPKDRKAIDELLEWR
ncbi:MAG TPA: nitroreductase family protein [Armatimonadota bacterium]|nr:nitroreductase family protein [Armatimonadota bacterium]